VGILFTRMTTRCDFGGHFREIRGAFYLAASFLPARRYASAGTSYGPVSVSVTSQCSVETVERIGLVFLAWDFFPPILHRVEGNSGTLKN